MGFLRTPVEAVQPSVFGGGKPVARDAVVFPLVPTCCAVLPGLGAEFGQLEESLEFRQFGVRHMELEGLEAAIGSEGQSPKSVERGHLHYLH